ncbi:MAG TPA: hypothetical protein VM286_03300 [Candidatus Thermoplasmatota archaeon]|nr:hypothetical protein [Candidatus Thermoplasmatota archaeon]
MPFPARLVLLALWVISLSGCTSKSICDGVALTHEVGKVTGTDMLVDDGALLLHAAASRVYVLDAEGCRAAQVSDIQVGDTVGHDATEIAASYPGQAWPRTIVIAR